MSQLIAQQIHDLLSGDQTSDELGEDVWAALFGDADPDETLMFLGAIRARMGRNNDSDAGMYFLMAAAFKRSPAHEVALNAHVKNLLKPKRRKGGDA